ERLDDAKILDWRRRNSGERLPRIFGKNLSFDQVLQNGLNRRSRRGQRLRQTVHRAVAAVADDQPALSVEHAQAVRHVVEREVELHIDLFELQLALEQFLAVLLEHLDGAGHVAEFIAVVSRRYRFGGWLPGQPAHVDGDALEPAEHAAYDGQAERSDQHQRGKRAGRYPKQQRPRTVEQRLDRGIGDIDLMLAILVDLVFQIVGNLAVHDRLLQRLVLRKIIGVERHPLAGLHQIGQLARDLRFKTVGDIIRFFIVQLSEQRREFRALGDERPLAEFEARPHDLGGRAFDNLAMLG